jgi:ribosomal 50S subunit-associated protein YjgA (DUF615 family)
MPRLLMQDARLCPSAPPVADAPLSLSKSQRQRDAHAFEALGVRLVALSAAPLARLELPEACGRGAAHALTRRAHASDTVYRQGDAAA